MSKRVGLIDLGPDEIRRLAEAAHATFEGFRRLLLDVMTPERCAFVRSLRCEEGGASWRYVAGECHRAWGASWEPPSNQLMGRALCDFAANYFGEDPDAEPWN